jgi:hypothetical protein
MIDLILSLGADPKGKDGRGRDVLMAAVHLDRERAIDYVVRNMEVDVAARSVDGFSALDYAIVRCNMAAALKLLPLFRPESIR